MITQDKDFLIFKYLCVAAYIVGLSSMYTCTIGPLGDSEVQRTMLELLNQLDGFEPKQNIKVRRFVRVMEESIEAGSNISKALLIVD